MGVTLPAYQQGSSWDLLQGPFLGSSLCGSKLQPYFSCWTGRKCLIALTPPAWSAHDGPVYKDEVW